MVSWAGTFPGQVPHAIPGDHKCSCRICRLVSCHPGAGGCNEAPSCRAGALVHRRVDEESGSLPPPDELAPEDRIAARSLLLSSPDLGMIARLDLLEGANGTVRPVDYKKGAPGPGALGNPN